MGEERQKVTPACPACGAKFQHDNVKQQCKACGCPDEVLAKGTAALTRWQKQHGLRKARAGSIHRRKKAHGRPRGARSKAR